MLFILFTIEIDDIVVHVFHNGKRIRANILHSFRIHHLFHVLIDTFMDECDEFQYVVEYLVRKSICVISA